MRNLLDRPLALALAAGMLVAGTGDAWASSMPEPQNIRGEIRDSVSGALLAGVEIRLEEQIVVSDASGQFSLRKGTPPYRLALSRPGQPAVIRDVSEVESLSTVVLLLDPKVRRAENVDVVDARTDDPAPASIPL
ncbi:MAG: carboxypeptidase-like regulatory domain-containing protein, partial [Vicinamibacteria bacterium]